MRALVAARLHQISEVDGNIEEAVAEILGAAPTHDEAPAARFVEWSAAKGLPPRPASPNSVALFVFENQGFGIETLLDILSGISAMHENISLADPVQSRPVSAALARISPVKPPRSWAKRDHEAFQRMPYTLQNRVVDREHGRDVEMRRLQNELAETKRALAEAPNQIKTLQDGKTTDGIHEKDNAPTPARDS
jgi:hypothetical protein